MVEYVDVVFGLAWGDEGKGKVTAALAQTQGYDAVARFSGGSNAGHTVYVEGEKFVTHLVPSGVFYDTLSVVGPGCVLHVEDFLGEIEKLENAGIEARRLVKVDPRCHIVMPKHRRWEARQSLSKEIGTTQKGIGPTYADKAYRTGVRAGDVPALTPFLLQNPLQGRILCEGAQGIWLDLDWGNYPYVTSSTTAPHGACSLGFSPRKFRHIIGVAKAYDTRVGADPDFPAHLDDDPRLQALQQVGKEFGATTGRVRRCNWLNLDKLRRAIELSGTDIVVVNKVDILTETGQWSFIYQGVTNTVSPNVWTATVSTVCKNAGAKEVMFSYSPEGSDLPLARWPLDI